MKLSITNFIDKVRSIYKEDFVPLHRPILKGNEKKYLQDCIDSNFVSSAGEMIIDFEKMIASYTKSKYAVSTSNGTSALHISLLLSGVEENTEVITQALTFVATGNAISYCNAKPIFLDVDKSTMGLCPQALSKFLHENTYSRENSLFNKSTDRRISACVPMHTFGHPCQIEEIYNGKNHNAYSVIKGNHQILEDNYILTTISTQGRILILNKFDSSVGAG